MASSWFSIPKRVKTGAYLETAFTVWAWLGMKHAHEGLGFPIAFFAGDQDSSMSLL